MSKLEDLTGQVFGKLKVLWRGPNQLGEAGDERAQWMCRCECGQAVLRPSRTLKRLKVGGCDACPGEKKKAAYHYERSVNGFMIRKVIKGESHQHHASDLPSEQGAVAPLN